MWYFLGRLCSFHESHVTSIPNFSGWRRCFLCVKKKTTNTKTPQPCLQVPEGETGPFISHPLIVWFPVAAGELSVDGGGGGGEALWGGRGPGYTRFFRKRRDGSRQASLQSFVQIPNGDIWRCVSVFFFHPPPPHPPHPPFEHTAAPVVGWTLSRAVWTS